MYANNQLVYQFGWGTHSYIKCEHTWGLPGTGPVAWRVRASLALTYEMSLKETYTNYLETQSNHEGTASTKMKLLQH